MRSLLVGFQSLMAASPIALALTKYAGLYMFLSVIIALIVSGMLCGFLAHRAPKVFIVIATSLWVILSYQVLAGLAGENGIRSVDAQVQIAVYLIAIITGLAINIPLSRELGRQYAAGQDDFDKAFK